jgi:hypothetical protein
MLKKVNNWHISIAVSILWLGILLSTSCGRQPSYSYWNGIYQPPQEINDYEDVEKELNNKE